MTKYTDIIVVAGVIALGCFGMGVVAGQARPKPEVICPDKSPREQLVSITITGHTTICTYSPSYGRSTRKAKA